MVNSWMDGFHLIIFSPLDIEGTWGQQALPAPVSSAKITVALSPPTFTWRHLFIHLFSNAYQGPTVCQARVPAKDSSVKMSGAIYDFAYFKLDLQTTMTVVSLCFVCLEEGAEAWEATTRCCQMARS